MELLWRTAAAWHERGCEAGNRHGIHGKCCSPSRYTVCISQGWRGGLPWKQQGVLRLVEGDKRALALFGAQPVEKPGVGCNSSDSDNRHQ